VERGECAPFKTALDRSTSLEQGKESGDFQARGGTRSVQGVRRYPKRSIRDLPRKETTATLLRDHRHHWETGNKGTEPRKKTVKETAFVRKKGQKLGEDIRMKYVWETALWKVVSGKRKERK